MHHDANYEKLFFKLEKFSSPSPGLRDKLFSKTVIRQVAKGNLLLKANNRVNKLWFLAEGFAKETAHDENYERISWFYFPGDFMYAYPSFFSQLPAFRDIESISKCVLIEITYVNLIQLRQEFTELETIIDLARDFCEADRAKYASRMQMLNARQRYDRFYNEHSNIFNVAKHKDILSFLGIKADSFSRFYKS
ncbi:cyclic nucleotide-binding domain-containing protein [Pedobacter agri]|uniref:Crp/Fnr family transcriptional regulator n=1 Tax=Pedobacter agri TaxID=454586 RepID=UPI00292D1164|nr:cyclic nucleotide-binding domain-containing protein [Pedobacter agri]